MHITLRIFLVLFLSECFCGSQVAMADEELQPMFNGIDFTGWVRSNTPEETWSYNDGMVVCSGKPIGELRTEKMYQNFVMELEWRHMVPRGNAGVFVWADDITSRGVPFHRGIEVQVLENAYGNTKSHTTHGDIFPIHGATMTPVNGRGGSRAFPTEERSHASPEWNHYRIECRDGRISLAVNGKVVTQGEDCSPRKGYICLESEGGVVHYQNVKIRELPSSEIAAEHVAISNRGYRSIYSGLNLSGWRAAPEEAQWKSNDWVLAFEGPKDSPGTLTSTETAAVIGAVVDVRLKNESSTAIIKVGDVVVNLSDEDLAAHREAAGRWNRIEVSAEDGQMFLLLNGHSIELPAKNVQPGVLQLTASGSVDFSNLYIRPLPK